MIYKERIKQLRERIGYTERYIANYLGISYSHYSNFENEQELMPTKYLDKISKLFNVSIDYLFGFTDKKKYDDEFRDINKELMGKRLKELRKELSMTQDKLADILITDQTTLSKYERGKNIIATPFLYDICKKYRVSADYLLGRVDEPKYF